MAHQCLECGEVYEEGSPELLQGCASCGGTRFFFTQSPVSEEDREQIQAEAREDLKGIVQQMLDQGVKPDYDDDIWSSDQRREWLAVDPETAGETVKEYVEEMADEAGDDEVPEGVADLVDEVDQGVIDSVQVDPDADDADEEAEIEPLLETGSGSSGSSRERASERDDELDLDRKPPIEEETPPEEEPTPGEVPPDPPTPETPAGADPEPVPLDMWAEAAEDEEADEDEESRPEVVTVTEPGSYEIDVEALMGDSPIIVQNDGSYLVHLPSLFRSKQVRQGD